MLFDSMFSRWSKKNIRKNKLTGVTLTSLIIRTSLILLKRCGIFSSALNIFCHIILNYLGIQYKSNRLYLLCLSFCNVQIAIAGFFFIFLFYLYNIHVNIFSSFFTCSSISWGRIWCNHNQFTAFFLMIIGSIFYVYDFCGGESCCIISVHNIVDFLE